MCADSSLHQPDWVTWSVHRRIQHTAVIAMASAIATLLKTPGAKNGMHMSREPIADLICSAHENGLKSPILIAQTRRNRISGWARVIARSSPVKAGVDVIRDGFIPSGTQSVAANQVFRGIVLLQNPQSSKPSAGKPLKFQELLARIRLASSAKVTSST